MIEQDLRDRIIAAPEALLEDRDVMQALVAANDRVMGGNVVDLRGVAMQRLEHRLDRLEDTHRAVIAAAYENLAGTNQVHRAILRLLEATGLQDLIAALDGDIARILRVECIRLAVEDGMPPPSGGRGAIVMLPRGGVAAYATQGRDAAPRPVALRRVPAGAAALLGADLGACGSEAILQLDLGAGRPAAMLILGARDPQQFKPTQGTDLLAFFAGVTERALRRVLP
jgi:hypothetical protein